MKHEELIIELPGFIHDVWHVALRVTLIFQQVDRVKYTHWVLWNMFWWPWLWKHIIRHGVFAWFFNRGQLLICHNTSITSPTARSHSELVSPQATLCQVSMSITNTNPPFPTLFIFLWLISSVAGNKCPLFTWAAGCRLNYHTSNALPDSVMSFISWLLHGWLNLFQIPTSFSALFFVTVKLSTSSCIGEYFFFLFKLEVTYLKTNLILIFLLVNMFLPFPTPTLWCILNFQLKG